MTEVASTAIEVFRRIGNANAACKATTYVAIPGNDRARWLLPTNRPEIATVLASWKPYRFKSRVGWSTVRAASKLGGLPRIPWASELQVECPGSANWKALGWPSHETPIPVIYLGTPGPKRKAVVHLVEAATGTCKAVVKVPLTKQAEIAVLREAEVLETLAGENFAHAPRLLYVDAVDGIATQTFVEGHSAAREMEQGVWRLLRSLMLREETTSLSARAGRWTTELGAGAHDLCVTSAIGELEDDSPLPACWQHGDFAPWNIRRACDGSCALVDWEDARRNALPLQDAFHFLHMQDFLFGAKPTLHAPEMRTEASSMGISAGQCRKLEVAYLVDSYVHCLQTENHERRRFVVATLRLRERHDA